MGSFESRRWSTGVARVRAIGYVPAPQMRVGVPKETAAGEHRVALVPEVVGKLKARGLEVLVQRGAGADALLPDGAFADAGAELTDDAAEVWRADVVVTISPPTAQEIGLLGAGSLLIGFLAPLTSPQTHQCARRREGDGARDGGDPADLPRAVDGRALLAVQRRRLPRGAAGGRADGALLPDADDRRRHDPAGEGARAGGRRGGPAGDRHRQTAGGAHDRLRRAPGGGRAGALAGRPVARPRPRGQRRGRLRARAHRGGARSPAAGADGRDQGLRRGHHHRPRARPPRAQAGDRGGGARDEAGVGGGGPRGGIGRQLRAHRAGADGGAPRRVASSPRSTSPRRCPSTPRRCSRATCSRCWSCWWARTAR